MKITKLMLIVLVLQVLEGQPILAKSPAQSLIEAKVAEVTQVKSDMEEAQRKAEEAAMEAEEKAKQEAEEKQKAEEASKQESEQSSSEASTDSQNTTSSSWTGSVLSAASGVNYGPSGKETYYNLDMSGVVSIMRGMGFSEAEYPYSVRSDGAKMLGDYIMVAANLSTHPRGTLVETSMGTGLVCDTGGFAVGNANQLDIATSW